MMAAMPSKTDPPRGRVEFGGQAEELFVVPRRASTPQCHPGLEPGPIRGHGKSSLPSMDPGPSDRVQGRAGMTTETRHLRPFKGCRPPVREAIDADALAA